MRAIDTNVVVRVLTGDDPVQSARARAILEAGDVFIPLTVILETEWVLRSIFRLGTAEVVEAFRDPWRPPRRERGARGPGRFRARSRRIGNGLRRCPAPGRADGREAILTFDRPFLRAARAAGPCVGSSTPPSPDAPESRSPAGLRPRWWPISAMRRHPRRPRRIVAPSPPRPYPRSPAPPASAAAPRAPAPSRQRASPPPQARNPRSHQIHCPRGTVSLTWCSPRIWWSTSPSTEVEEPEAHQRRAPAASATTRADAGSAPARQSPRSPASTKA